MKTRLLYSVVLKASHVDTGKKTRHTVGGRPMPRPHQLKIVQYTDDDGFYLLYCDSGGEEMSDGLHATLADAFNHAQLEFGIAQTEWKAI